MAVIKKNYASLIAVLCLLCIVLVAHQITAAPVNLPLAGAMNTSRPCSHLGTAKSDVAATSATTNRSAAMAVNTQVYVTCDVDVHMLQGASAVTGNTTTGTVLWDHIPYWFMAETSGQYFAFTKKSGEADGTCYVTECR